MTKVLPSKKPLRKQRLMTASYLLLVSATVASTYVLATSERLRTGIGSYVSSEGAGPARVHNQWDAESVCEARVAGDYPSHSVLSVDSRSTRQLANDAYHVVVQVDAPDHYSNDITYVICKANLNSGYVSSYKLGADEPDQALGMDFKNLF